MKDVFRGSHGSMAVYLWQCSLGDDANNFENSVWIWAINDASDFENSVWNLGTDAR